MTTTHRRPPKMQPQRPTAPEPITVERITNRPFWPIAGALMLAAIVGPAVAWLLLFAALSPSERIGVAAGVPVALGLLGAAAGAIADHQEEAH